MNLFTYLKIWEAKFFFHLTEGITTIHQIEWEYFVIYSIHMFRKFMKVHEHSFSKHMNDQSSSKYLLNDLFLHFSIFNNILIRTHSHSNL